MRQLSIAVESLVPTARIIITIYLRASEPTLFLLDTRLYPQNVVPFSLLILKTPIATLVQRMAVARSAGGSHDTLAAGRRGCNMGSYYPNPTPASDTSIHTGSRLSKN